MMQDGQHAGDEQPRVLQCCRLSLKASYARLVATSSQLPAAEGRALGPPHIEHLQAIRSSSGLHNRGTAC